MQIQKNDDDSTKRIKSEFNHLYQNPFSGIGIPLGIPDPENIYIWRITLLAPKDTSYRGGLFFLNIILPRDYPEHPPEFCFKTPIYHTNVNPIKPNKKEDKPLGHVWIPFLSSMNYKSIIREVIPYIFGLFYIHNPDSPYALDRAKEFKENKTIYEQKAKYFTKKYANLVNANKENNESWDFSYI